MSFDSGRVRKGVASLLERGYCVVEGSLDARQCALATEVLDGLIAGGQAHETAMGYVIHPLCTRDGRIHDLFCDPTVLAIMAGVFEDDVRLMHSGSRVSDQRSPRLGWHAHPYTAEESQIPPGDHLRGSRPVRLLCNWYVDGSTPESGPLVVLPRRYDDPLAPPALGRGEPWPGEVAVTCAPGSAVIFSIDLWHCALAGTADGRRRLFGGHFQGWNNPRPHREDQVHEGPVIEASFGRNPTFAGLLQRG